jgi:hypothetical protein
MACLRRVVSNLYELWILSTLGAFMLLAVAAGLGWRLLVI